MISDFDIQDIEIKLLLKGIYEVYGYDFQNYAYSSLKRRVLDFLKKRQIHTCSELQALILYDKKIFDLFLIHLSITVTEMFRDPLFYEALANHVLTNLGSYPFFKIWIAGCSTGEEVYSVAIFLHEFNLLHRVTIYATDFNNYALKSARTGIYKMDHMHEYEKNYLKSGGKHDFFSYFQERYGSVKINSMLQKKITFANHNLVCDKSFGEMDVIICRNVLIYFNMNLQNHVLSLFNDSLKKFGYLCLGTKESLKFSCISDHYKIIQENAKIYQKRS